MRLPDIARERGWPVYESPDGSVVCINADCLQVLPLMEKGSVDAVVTDPPYGMRNNNDYSRFTGGPNGHGDAHSRKYAPTIGDDRPFDPSPFVAFPAVILWGANHFAAKLPAGTTLVWIKRLDGGFGTFLSDAEIGWKKGGCGVYCRRDVSMYSDPTRRIHPNEKPVGIMEWCLSFLPDADTILDPFMGSGTTGIACIRTGRRFIGVELDRGYFDKAVQRIKDELDKRDGQGPLMRAARLELT